MSELVPRIPDSDLGFAYENQRLAKISAAAKGAQGALRTRGERPRGRKDWWTEWRNLDDVESLLPTFHGKNLREIVGGLSREPRPRVWDLGSGDSAIALSGLVNEFPHIEGIGVTMPIVRGNLNHPDNVNVVRQDVDEFLETFDRNERPDLIYMSRLLTHMHNPLLTLQESYNALAENGTLLVDEIDNYQSPLIDHEGRPVNPNHMLKSLKEEGYDVEMVVDDEVENDVYKAYKFAIRKTVDHPELHLPVRIVLPEQVGVDLDSARATETSPFYHVPREIKYLYQFAPRQQKPAVTTDLLD